MHLQRRLQDPPHHKSPLHTEIRTINPLSVPAAYNRRTGAEGSIRTHESRRNSSLSVRCLTRTISDYELFASTDLIS